MAGRGHQERECPLRRPGPPRSADAANRRVVFIDGAMSLVGRAVPGPTLKDVKRRLLAAQKHVLQNGLTGVHDAGISKLVAEAYRELDREGQLVVRVYGMASPPGGRRGRALVSRPPQSSSRWISV